jgi:P-type Cu+ transporter
VVDKTGTLTEGRPRLLSVRAIAPFSEDELLKAAAGLERRSGHPLAQAVVEGAEARSLGSAEVADFQSRAGLGLEGRVDGRRALLGSLAFLREQGVEAGPFERAAAGPGFEGATVVCAAFDGKPAGVLALADPIKASSREALKELRAAGVRVFMATGDREEVARSVANSLGIEEVRAGMRPEAKLELVEALRREGRKVAMAGDGINDAPALARADVGIAMGTGADVAMESAGITLAAGDLRALARARKLSQATLRNIRQNLFLAFVYNAVGVPIAAGALYPWTGLLLSPMLAAGAMTLSSLSVVGNALRLRKVEL